MEIAAANKKLPGVIDLIRIIITFMLTACAFIFFRAPTVSDAFGFIFKFFSLSLFKIPDFFAAGKMVIGSIAISIPILIVVEWINRNETHEFKKQPKNKILRWIGYIIITLLIIELAGLPQGFIYFQF
ncbi:hypothetical protein FACS189461_0710 [Spirochaetia bacterium]|nr:hypothetical protein FACS189461_0710 [Spirochaetia bacterium]